MTAQETNEAVARKLGWSISPAGNWMRTIKNKNMMQYELPRYTTEIRAAFEIVERLVDRSLFIKLLDEHGYSDEWTVFFDDLKNTTQAEASAPTAPLAICLAFLKLP